MSSMQETPPAVPQSLTKQSTKASVPDHSNATNATTTVSKTVPGQVDEPIAGQDKKVAEPSPAIVQQQDTSIAPGPANISTPASAASTSVAPAKNSGTLPLPEVPKNDSPVHDTITIKPPAKLTDSTPAPVTMSTVSASTSNERVMQRKLEASLWMDKGQQAFLDKNWDSAKLYYANAIALAPPVDRQQFARRRLAEIDLQIRSELAADSIKNSAPALVTLEVNSATPLVTGADSAGTNTSAAKETAAEPAAKKPAVLSDSVQTVAGKQQAAGRERILDLLINAQKALIEKKFDSARSYYKEVLTLDPTPYQKEFSNREIKTLDAELGKTQHTSVPNTPAPATKRDTLATNMATKPTKSKMTAPIIQKNLDTARSGSMAPFLQLGKTVMAQPNRLSISDSTNSITVTCENIVFNGREAYLKLLIHNKNSLFDFYGDDLRMTYIKNYGILIKSRPVNITGTPNVMAGNQTELVYVTEAFADVQPNEVFILEIEDMKKQTKLTLHIPGEDYMRLRNL